MATYMGKPIKPGTDAEIRAQIDAINAEAAGRVQGASTDVPSSGVPARNDMTGSGYDSLSSDPSYNPNAGMMPTPEPGATPQSIANQTFLYPNQYAGGGYTPTPTLSAGEAINIASPYGFNPKEFTGMTLAQANAKINEKKKAIGEQVSTNTSYTYNPETVAGFNKTFKDLKFKIDESNANPWMNEQNKRQVNEATISSFTDQFAKLFPTVQDLQGAMQNPDFQKTLQNFQGIGGDINAVAARIAKNGQQPGTVSVTGEVLNPDGSYKTSYSDGTSDNRRLTMNPDGTYSSNPVQTLDEYLGNLSNPSQQKAYESLIPERDAAQQQIALEQSIPEKYRKYYFGTEEEVGFIQQQRQQKEEEIKLIERKAELDKENTQAQAAYMIDKNNAEMQVQQSEIEENRLNAKTYMTGMLAKLGALQTTGAAPEAIANLDMKYKNKAAQIFSSYTLANRSIELKLKEAVDKIAIDRDSDILKTRQDLSKTEEDVWKETYKLQNDADKNTLKIVERFSSDFRAQTDKYAKEAKSEAEQYVKDFVSYAGKGYDMKSISQLLSGSIAGVTPPNKKKAGSGTKPVSGTKKYTPTEINALSRAGLSDVAESDKSYFLNTAPAFRQWFTRKVSSGESLPTLSGAYEQWQKETSKSSKGREI